MRRPGCVALVFLWPAWAAGLGAEAPPLRVFEEKERTAMLRAYHARMGQARPIGVSDRAAWEKRRREVVRRRLEGLGLEPPPPRVPLDVTWGSSIERDDCTISRLGFQTFPGFYAVAFLYMPKRAAFPAPAVLHPHGHWANWSADDIVQSRCLGLARRGYVSLAIQYEHFEDPAIGLTQRGVFLWNNLRGLDVLQSLPQVDKERIGVTGASGGGMQAMDLAATDERVKAAVIGVFPTYYHRILYIHACGCWCNYAPLGALTFTDQHEAVALIAPRPTVVFSVTGDWTAPSIDHEMKEVAAVYDLFPDGDGPPLSNVEGSQPYRRLVSRHGRFLVERFEGPHDYTRTMRERLYWWMDWWLRGKRTAQPEPEGELHLTSASALQQLRLPSPKGHQWSNGNLAAVLRPARQYHPPVLRSRADVDAHRQRLREVLARLLGETDLVYGRPRASHSLGRQNLAGWDVERLWYASEPDVRIPALLIQPAGVPAADRRPVTIVVAANGKNDVFLEPWRSRCQERLGQGHRLLAIDPRLRGEWAYEPVPAGQVPAITWAGNARVWGRPELGMAVSDIRAAVDYLAGRPDSVPDQVHVVGWGQLAGFAALAAAALDDRIGTCTSDLMESDFRLGRAAPAVGGILRHGDVGEIAALVAPRPLVLLNVNARTDLRTAEAAYAISSAADRLRRVTEEAGPWGRVPVVNAGFEEGTKGWMGEDGSPPRLCTSRADLGRASLELVAGQTVLSEPVAVEPLRETRLTLHVSKPWQTTLEVFLLRGRQRYPLAADTNDYIDFAELSYDFLPQPQEHTVRIGLSVARGAGGTDRVLVDSLEMLQGRPVTPVKPDGRELLHVTDFTGMAVGTALAPKRAKAACFLAYGPGATAQVVADPPGAGRPKLLLKSGAGTYVACACPARGPLVRGGTYRLEVTAQGRGRLDLCFWDIPAHRTARLAADLTAQEQTYGLDFFVESASQENALPIVSVTGEALVDRLSLRLVEARPGQ